MATEKFAEVQGGGSLMLAWQVRDKPVLVIGGGEVSYSPRPSTFKLYKTNISPSFPKKVAAGRILNCLNADAHITILAPSSGLHPEVAHRIHTLSPPRITHIDGTFSPSILDSPPNPSWALVLCAIDDPSVSTQVYKECQARRIPANIADVPPECDFYFGAVHRQGPLQVMVSTNGKGPRMAALVKRWIARNLPAGLDTAVERVGALRAAVRKANGGTGGEDVRRRMEWVSGVCNTWSVEELGEMEEGDVERLVEWFERGNVPKSLGEVRGETEGEEGVVGFDGSFGWWI
jgi:precorrin-2 dehydrogenase / sirohydrochlorin ferrochelatase